MTGTATEDCTLFQTSLWVSVCLVRVKQLPGPLAIGSRDSPSLGYKQAPRPAQDLLAGKRGPALSALWVARQQPLDLWNQPTSHVAVQQKKIHRDRLSPQLREKYIFGTILFTCTVSIFERPLRGWPSLTDRGTIPVGPVILGAAQL